MTTKDYQAVADALLDLRRLRQPACDGVTLRRVTYALADVFEADNPRFKRDLFLDAACRVS